MQRYDRTSLHRRGLLADVGKVAACVIALFSVGSQAAFAQTSAASSPPDRTMPAFAVMDSSIMSIETVDPLQTATLTTFSTLRHDDLMPRDIGIEFVPFLFMPVQNPRTVWEGYRDLYAATPGAVPLQYLAVAVAFSQAVERVPSERLSEVALSARTFLVAGRPNARLKQLLDDLESRSKALDEEIRRQADERQREAAEIRAGELFVESRALLSDLAAVPKNRVGFMLETGAAAVMTVPENTISASEFERWSYWGTPIYRFDRWSLAVAGVGRITGVRGRLSRAIDGGGRVTWTPRRASITLTLESLGRRRFFDVELPEDDVWNARVIGGVNRSVGRAAQISFGFGKNYKDNFAGGGTLTAFFEIKLGLGDLPVDTMP